MDTTFTTTPGRRRTPSRDHTQVRKVHLDTYARKRAGISDAEVVQQQQVAEIIPSTASIPQSIPQNTIPVQPVLQQIQPAAPVTPVAIPAQPVVPVVNSVVPQSAEVAPAQPVQQQPAVHTSQPKASYLESITTRQPNYHTQAHVPQQSSVTLPQAQIQQPPEATPAQSEHLEANLKALYTPTLTEQMTSANTSSASHIRTVVASALTCGVLAIAVFGFVTRLDAQPVIAQPIGAPVIEVEVPVAQTAPKGKPTSNTNDRVARDPSHPVRLVISSIGVNAQVDGLGTTSEGLIAVPQAYGVVGWYNKGAIPGKPGPAVMVGHFTGGYGGVFDKLGDLKNGDLITTTNGRGESVTYKVTRKKEYAKDKVPMQQIFEKSDESKLEIITCAGKWQSDSYNNRLVVSAEIVK